MHGSLPCTYIQGLTSGTTIATSKGSSAMTDIPNEDQPDFVAENPEHCYTMLAYPGACQISAVARSPTLLFKTRLQRMLLPCSQLAVCGVLRYNSAQDAPQGRGAFVNCDQFYERIRG
jgi:hypothetical protein